MFALWQPVQSFVHGNEGILSSEGLQASGFILDEFEVTDIKLIKNFKKTTLRFEAFIMISVIEAPLDVTVTSYEHLKVS